MLKSLFFTLSVFAPQIFAMSVNVRSNTVQLIEEVYNRKNVNALDNFYAEDAIFRKTLFNNGAMTTTAATHMKKGDIKGLERIKATLLNCPIFGMLRTVYTIEDSVVDNNTKTIRYVMAIHGALLNNFEHDLLRLSVMHRFNNQGKIILTEVYGDTTAVISKLNRDRIPESQVNQMKAQRLEQVINNHGNLNVLNDLMDKNVKVYTPEQQVLGLRPLNWAESKKRLQEFEACFSETQSSVNYVMHEQSRPNEVALVWEWSGKFTSKCPVPYPQKPTGKAVTICGVSEYQFNRENGQISEMRHVYDTEDIARQMRGQPASAVSNSCSSMQAKRGDSFKGSISEEMLLM
jgi:hypothetical protein